MDQFQYEKEFGVRRAFRRERADGRAVHHQSVQGRFRRAQVRRFQRCRLGRTVRQVARHRQTSDPSHKEHKHSYRSDRQIGM